jgi:hypothetical protein
MVQYETLANVTGDALTKALTQDWNAMYTITRANTGKVNEFGELTHAKRVRAFQNVVKEFGRAHASPRPASSATATTTPCVVAQTTKLTIGKTRRHLYCWLRTFTNDFRCPEHARCVRPSHYRASAPKQRRGVKRARSASPGPVLP